MSDQRSFLQKYIEDYKIMKKVKKERYTGSSFRNWQDLIL